MIDESELVFLERAVELAEQALEAGDGPFGTVLVLDGRILFEDRNRNSLGPHGDETRHPEFEAARWAAANLRPEERPRAVTYTSTEHCPMCGAAHGWVGLGRIVYATSGEQIGAWRRSWGWPEPPVTAVPVDELVPGIRVDGPVPQLEERLRSLHERAPRP